MLEICDTPNNPVRRWNAIHFTTVENEDLGIYKSCSGRDSNRGLFCYFTAKILTLCATQCAHLWACMPAHTHTHTYTYTYTHAYMQFKEGCCRADANYCEGMEK